jgi:RNA recognition motif-containing protein
MDQATGAIPLPAVPVRVSRNEEAAFRAEVNADVFVEQPAPTRRLSVADLHAAASRYVEPVPQVVEPPVEVQSRTSNRFITLNSQTFQPPSQLPAAPSLGAHRQAHAQAQATIRPAGFTRGNPANVNPRFRNHPSSSAFQQTHSTFSGNNNISRNRVAAGTGPFPPSPYAPIQGNQPRNFAHQQNRTMIPSMSYEYLTSVTLPEFEKLGLPKVLTPPNTFTLLNGPASETFNYLTQHGRQRPPMDIAFQGRYEPFVQRALERRPLCAAILKIDDLPYEVKNSDIVAYIGGTAKILNDNEEPIHIMMERITTKTGAAYIEFYDARSAYKVVEKHNNARTQGKPIRIQNRMVTASISSHDALMQDLFPCARGVTWRNGEPYVQPGNTFKGFVSEEELIGLVKNIEFPGRVSFIPLISHPTSRF